MTMDQMLGIALCITICLIVASACINPQNDNPATARSSAVVALVGVVAVVVILIVIVIWKRDSKGESRPAKEGGSLFDPPKVEYREEYREERRERRGKNHGYCREYSEDPNCRELKR